MSTNAEIGTRVKDSLVGSSQTWLAEQVAMTKDSMSRALNGHRGFSSVEIARVAETLNVDVHWLITGRPDPLKLSVAARHDYDPTSGQRSNQGRGADDHDLQAIALAYRQAYGQTPRGAEPLPQTPDELRGALGEDFVLHFADRLEERLDVDVIRLQGLSTAYSFTMGGRRVIVLPSILNWWRSNFDLAHELAHLALGHHEVHSSSDSDDRELAANQFAAALLLPKTLIRGHDWEASTPASVAQFLWDHGIGTATLANRLDTLGVAVPDAVAGWLRSRMPGALRPHQAEMDLPRPDGSAVFRSLFDPIDARLQAASRRRFPSTLITAHRQRIEKDGINPATLAWMLESLVEDVIEDSTADRQTLDLLDAFGA